MKTMTFISGQPLAASQVSPTFESVIALPEPVPIGRGERRSLRHILLGHPEDIRQTIHLLHTLHYSETVLWSPVMIIEEPLMIAPARGEAISLLRKLV